MLEPKAGEARARTVCIHRRSAGFGCASSDFVASTIPNPSARTWVPTSHAVVDLRVMTWCDSSFE